MSHNGRAGRRRLYLLVKNPFSARDYERMGVAELSDVFDVRVLDCTPWVLPEALSTRVAEVPRLSVTTIRSFAELRRVLSGDRDGIAIDYIGAFSARALAIFWMIRLQGIALVVLDSGGVPYPGRQGGRWARAKAWVASHRHKGPLGLIGDTLARPVVKALPKARADVAFMAGRYCEQDPRFTRAHRVVASHSFDYEQHLRLAGAPSPYPGPYAVYVDEKITGHEDDAEMGLPAVASESRFIPALEDFLRRFSDATGLPVVIAAYPSSDAARHERLWPGREVVQGRTALLIRHAAIVFTHASTAASFAVLARRPLVHLTSQEIAASWYAPWVEAMRHHTRVPLHDVDSAFPSRMELDRWLQVDEPSYRSFEEMFVRAPGCSDETLWTRVVRVLQTPAASAGVE